MKCRKTALLCGVMLLVSSIALAAKDRSAAFGFQAMEILKLDWDLGHPLCDDINGDGLNDLVVANNRKSRIDLLIQKSDFDPERVVLTPRENQHPNDLIGHRPHWRFRLLHYPLDEAIYDLLAMDLNGDQRTDLVYSCAKGLYIVYQDKQGSQTRPEPRWSQAVYFEVSGLVRGTKSISCGDLNGDGLVDLVALGTRGYTLWQQLADGGFGKPERIYSTSVNNKQVEIGDVNGDGRADMLLLAPGNKGFPLIARIQGPHGRLGPESLLSLPAPAYLSLCRLNAGFDTVVSVAQQSGRLGCFTVQENGQPDYSISAYPLDAGGDTQGGTLRIADVNGDGLSDIIATHPQYAQFRVYLGQAGLSLAPARIFPGLKDMRKVCAGRLTHQDQDTVLVLSQEEKLIASAEFRQGRLGFPQPIHTVGEPLAMDLAHMDQDGDLDLVYLSRDEDDMYALRILHSIGRPDMRVGRVLELDMLDEGVSDLLTGDIDHDGRLDVMVVREFDPVLLIRQTEPNELTVQPDQDIHVGFVSDIEQGALSIGPFGPNGSSALLIAQGDFVRSVCFRAPGGWQVIDQYQGSTESSRIQRAMAFQPPGQAHPDLVTYDESTKTLAILTQQADRAYATDRDIKIPGGAVHALHSGHFFDPNKTSLLVYAQNSLFCIKVESPGLTLQQGMGFEPTVKKGRLGRFAAGDMNADGRSELVLIEQDQHHIQILAVDDTGKLVERYRFKVYEHHQSAEDAQRFEGRKRDSGQPRTITLADVTGDNKTDLILQVHDRIIVYPQGSGE
jgi:hypothetical protein